LRDFVSIVAGKKQQYRQNQVCPISLTTGYTRGYKDVTLPGLPIFYKIDSILLVHNNFDSIS